MANKKIEPDMKTLFLESNKIEGFDEYGKDEQPMLDQTFVAWEFLRNIAQGKLTHADICKLHKILAIGQDNYPERLMPNEKGYYRGIGGNNVNVYIGNRVGVAPGLVSSMMDNWLLDYNENKIDPKTMHIRYERIHPFVDINGRTGRLLMWHQELQNEMYPTEVWYSHRWDYYEWFD